MSLPAISIDPNNGINVNQTNTIRDIDSLFDIIHCIKNNAEKNPRNNSEEITRIDLMTQEKCLLI